jgi:hypothetical protein
VDNIIVEKAVYDTSKETLTVKATSSDKTDTPKLSLPDFENRVLETGEASFPPGFLPPIITIKSDAGGSITVPVTVEGSPTGVVTAPIVSVPFEIAVTKGAPVTMEAKNSGGEVSSILWEQVNPEGTPITLNGSDTLIASFTADQVGKFTFSVKLTGPTGLTDSAEVIVHVTEAALPDPVANPGTNTIVKQGSTVKLDGSKSVGAISYQWTQVSGTKVTFKDANTATPSFVFPKKFEQLVFELTVTAANGKTGKARVTINSHKDIITVGQNPSYSTRTGRWNIIGTTDVFGPLVTIDIYRINGGTKIGSAVVDELGNWRFRGTSQGFLRGETIYLKSSSGGELKNIQVQVGR